MPSRATKRRLREAGHAVQPGAHVPQSKQEPAAGRQPAVRTYPRNPAAPLRRLYAWIVDASVIVLAVMVLSQTTRGVLFSKEAAPQDIFLFLAYFIIPTGIWGRTLGKWVAGIVVVDENGRTPGVAVAIPREVAWKVISYAAAGLGLAWILFDKERRGWHDRLAGTWVVNVPDAGAPLLGRLFRRR